VFLPMTSNEPGRNRPAAADCLGPLDRASWGRPFDDWSLMIPDLVPTVAVWADTPQPPAASSLADLEPGSRDDIVDEWGRQSFPASDPPANW
jgi:hypothetical protein